MSAPEGPGPGELAHLSERLGYRFQDQELLVRALTHGSSRTTFSGTNERLEFLGDAVLDLMVSLFLYARFPDFQEGRMTKVKSQVVSRRSLGVKARELDLARFLVVGRMFADPGAITGSVLSNALEAVIGAVYLDGGFEAAYDLVIRLFEGDILAASDEPGLRDYKSHLGQWAQRSRQGNPVYHLVATAGPDHSRTFEVFATVGPRRFPAAWGRSKKEAEQRAARVALQELGLL